LVAVVLAWQRVSGMQEQLARQSADASAVAVEARTLARQAEALARDVVTRVGVAETRLGEVVLQRRQLEDLMQSLSRSRDENLVVDIESAVRLALQQAQLAGSVEPLVATLRSAEQRVARSAQPRLLGVQRALLRDLEAARGAAVADTGSLLLKLDELARLADEVPLINGPAPTTTATSSALANPPSKPAVAASELSPVKASAATSAGAASAPGLAQPWHQTWEAARAWLDELAAVIGSELRALLRVSRIDQPDAVLLAPEQAFFLRENLKLKLLNARLGVLARQPEAIRTDLAAVDLALRRYFDPSSRRTQQALSLVQQLLVQSRQLALPRVDDTLAALSAAAVTR
jgi:uroporphyrin-3 C-methyltransferase